VSTDIGIFIEPHVDTDDGLRVLVSELFVWLVEGESVALCGIAGSAYAVTGGQMKSCGGRVTLGTGPGRLRGGCGERPAKYSKKQCFTQNCNLKLQVYITSESSFESYSRSP